MMDRPWIAPYGVPAANIDTEDNPEKPENSTQRLTRSGVVYSPSPQQKGRQRARSRRKSAALLPDQSSLELEASKHQEQHLLCQGHRYSKSAEESLVHIHNDFNQEEKNPIDPLLLDYDKFARLPGLTTPALKGFLESVQRLSNTDDNSTLFKQRDALLKMFDLKTGSVQPPSSMHPAQKDDSTKLTDDLSTTPHNLPDIVDHKGQSSRASLVGRSIIGETYPSFGGEIHEFNLFPVLAPERIVPESESKIAERNSMGFSPLYTPRITDQINNQVAEETIQGLVHLDLNEHQLQQVQQGSVLKKPVIPEKSSHSRNLSFQKTDQILATESLNLEVLDTLSISEAIGSHGEIPHPSVARKWEPRLSAHRPYPYITAEHHSYQVAAVGLPHHLTKPKHSERALLEANELVSVWKNGVDHSTILHEDEAMQSHIKECLGVNRNERLETTSDEPQWIYGQNWDDMGDEDTIEDLGNGLEDARLVRDLLPSLYEDLTSKTKGGKS